MLTIIIFIACCETEIHEMQLAEAFRVERLSPTNIFLRLLERYVSDQDIVRL